MRKRQCLLVLGCFIFSMTAFSGCAETPSTVSIRSDSVAHMGVIHRPQMPANIHTMEDARKDLKQVLEKDTENENLGAQFNIDYFSQYNVADPSSSKVNFLEGGDAYEDASVGYSRLYLVINRLKSISALEDRLQISKPLVIPYADLSCWPITYDSDFVYLGGEDDMTLFLLPLYTDANDAEKAFDAKKVERIANDLFFIQQQFKTCPTRPPETAARFEALAKQYREQTVKPSISEEQRKYIVQANLLTKRKNYIGAIGLYRKAIAVNPVDYPEAYSNMALLYAQENYYQRAIDQMKRYLLLVPDARDARSAQDKIYEWELQMKKN
jgi:tetratricopeptide (TPR) repeat protein